MMVPKTLMTMALISFALFAGFQSLAMAQEHPEHPTEHPASKQMMMTKDVLAKAIEDYVKSEAALKGGYFLFFDKKENAPLALTLDRVHKERLAKLKPDVYFACADFKATNGHMYDLDIFMKGKPENLKVTQITLHKKDGKARYKWVKEGDFWKRK